MQCSAIWAAILAHPLESPNTRLDRRLDTSVRTSSCQEHDDRSGPHESTQSVCFQPSFGTETYRYREKQYVLYMYIAHESRPGSV